MSEITKLVENLIIKKIDKETINVQITDNQILMLIVGQFDQNLKDLSKLTKTKVLNINPGGRLFIFFVNTLEPITNLKDLFKIGFISFL